MSAKVSREERQCIECGTTFLPISNVQICCSKECGVGRNNRIRAQWYRDNKKPRKVSTRNCKFCKKEFKTDTKRQLCSEQCQYNNKLLLNKNNPKYQAKIKNKERVESVSNRLKSPLKTIYNSEYVLNKELYIELVWCMATGRRTRKLENMFYTIVSKLSSKFRYSNPDDRMDLIQVANLRLLTFWHKFDGEKSTNAFAYITEIAKRAFVQGWNELYGSKKGISHFSLSGEILYNI